MFTKASTVMINLSDFIVHLLEPFVSPKNILKMSEVLKFLSSIAFLRKVWDDVGIEDDVCILVDAMNEFIKFEL